MSSSQNPLNYSKTQRIVLLIDLNPLISNPQNPNFTNYFTSILTCAKSLLNFSSNSLSSFKFFFSSLSPLISYSTLRKLPIPNPNSLSFNHSHETLISLSETLNSISNVVLDCGVSGSGSRGLLTCSSIAQVIHDYGWDNMCDEDDLMGVVRSNLVVLFSPVCRSFDDLCNYMGVVGDNDDVVSNCDVVCDKFKEVFGHVRDAFVSRDIHLCWVDVKCEIECSDPSDNFDEYGRLMRLFGKGVNGLGWGFCSSDSIVLGSALVSFGLIYPMIGVSTSYSDFGDTCKKVTGQLNLEILDVSGKPLECKYCDLQMLDVMTLYRERPDGVSHPLEYGEVGVDICQQVGGVWESFSNGLVKVHVKAICRYSEFMNIEEHTSDVILVHELPVDSRKKKEESSGDFFADRVLELLSKETDKYTKRKSPPLWQILLSFLYRRGYWALLSLSNNDGSIATGVLKPFTIHSAYIFIMKDTDTHCGAQFGLSDTTLGKIISRTGDNIGASDIGMDSVNVIQGGESKRKHKKQPHRYKDLSWRTFCKAAYEHCNMELEEAYLSKGCDSSKKLKFLKCWMKQVVKNGSYISCNPGMLKIHSQDREKAKERSSQAQEESEQPLPSLVAEAGKLTHAEEATTSLPEASEAFFSNLSGRIQHGIESGVDLVAFAKRVVSSCIYWLSRKLRADINEDCQASVEKSDCSSSGGLVAAEIIKILLKDPKYLAGKNKDGALSSKEHDTKPSQNSSEDKIREYELQILFRMEILQSEVAVGIRDSTKHKFVKQICSLLEFIQCNMEDGFFGDFNLNDYVGRTITSRYSQNLAGVVHRIYEQMDLLLFDDEDESPNPLLNSEDSNQSWRVGDSEKGSLPNSTEDSISGPVRYNELSQKENGRADFDRKLVEAQQRRERASRFASSTRRAMPELQRVWAPKPLKLSRSNSDSICRSKRKSRQRENCYKVCETPLSGAKKCLFPGDNASDQERREQWGRSTGSAHKALFQDESLHDDWKP